MISRVYWTVFALAAFAAGVTVLSAAWPVDEILKDSACNRVVLVIS